MSLFCGIWNAHFLYPLAVRAFLLCYTSSSVSDDSDTNVFCSFCSSQKFVGPPDSCIQDGGWKPSSNSCLCGSACSKLYTMVLSKPSSFTIRQVSKRVADHPVPPIVNFMCWSRELMWLVALLWCHRWRMVKVLSMYCYHTCGGLGALARAFTP